MPYSFYVDDVEILESLKKAIAESKADTEAAIKIIYQPQAIFRVRPVTRCTGSMAGHSAPVITMQFSPDGNQLVSGAGDSTVRFWDLDTSTPLFECKGRERCEVHSHCFPVGHKQWITCVAWAPDMSLVASGGASLLRSRVVWGLTPGRLRWYVMPMGAHHRREEGLVDCAHQVDHCSCLAAATRVRSATVGVFGAEQSTQ